MRARVLFIRNNYFVAFDGVAEIFVHQMDCDFAVSDLRRRDLVEIMQVNDGRGKRLRGIGVSLVERPPEEPFEGEVVNLNSERGYLHARCADENWVFCHVSEFLDPSTFDQLRLGDWVAGERVKSDRGYAGVKLARLKAEFIPGAVR